MLTTPNTYKIPMFTSAICNEISRPNKCTLLPHGITAPTIIAVSMARHGPRINKNLDEKLGMISSLKNNFNPSASGCKIPNGPARLGPLLSCKTAATLRSIYVEYIAITSEPLTTAIINTNFSIKTNQSIANIINSKCKI